MGSFITLGLGNLEIDWGKNEFFRHHSQLYLPSDICQIPYYYADEVVEEKEGLSSSLDDVCQRLELMGYADRQLRLMYERHFSDVPSYHSIPQLSFDEFQRILTSVDISKVSATRDDPAFFDQGEFASDGLFQNLELKKFLPEGFSIDREAGLVLESLDPYLILKVLGQNPLNRKEMVQWRFADVVEEGWVTRDEILGSMEPTSKILIVTEGSSDSYVLSRVLKCFKPRLADFFRFVDMEENYPFTGAGNLYKFCQGLSTIVIQNRVLVVFDNDAAGVEKYELAKALGAPPNMHICKLPDHESFLAFETVGPNGLSIQDINGCAVAIENFLDLTTVEPTQRLCRWTNYNRKLNRYQGELEGKNELVRKFKQAQIDSVSYDSTMLEFLARYIIEQCVENIL